MGGIESKSVWFFLPALADKFVVRESSKSLETFGEVVGSNEVAEMSTKLVMVFAVIALHGGFFDRAIHALDLAVGPGMVRFRQPVLDGATQTNPVERIPTEASRWAFAVFACWHVRPVPRRIS
jgi:hypothetical protein